jgi:sterol desaturase/sphingolipid hydroxylase (fatty acid hydroxylase superfamily)
MPPPGEYQSAAAAGLEAWPTPRRARWLSLERLGVVCGFAAYLVLVFLGWQAALRFLPDHLSLNVAGHALRVANVHDKIAGDGLVAFCILPAALWIELTVVGWRGSSLRALLVRPTASIRTDIVYFLASEGHLMDLAGKVLMLGASMISGMVVRDWLRAHFGVYVDPSGLPVIVQVGLFFGLYTFFDYWTHRIDHTRYFWALHRYHHAARDFCVVNAVRQHPAALVTVFLINLPMAVLGASPSVMIYVNVLTAVLGFIIHSRIDSNFGWVGRYVIQSPNHHRLHHKLDMSHPTGHFGMAPVWDHLFGTWYGEADQTLEIGVARPYRHGLWIVPDLLRDYADFWMGFFRRAAD